MVYRMQIEIRITEYRRVANGCEQPCLWLEKTAARVVSPTGALKSAKRLPATPDDPANGHAPRRVREFRPARLVFARRCHQNRLGDSPARRWTAESGNKPPGAERAPTYIINVTRDGEFVCSSNDVNAFPDGTVPVATLAEAEEVCEQREKELARKKR